MRASFLVLALLSISCASAPAPQPPVDDAASIHALLDAWHKAASTADEETYFGSFSDDAIFFGTDGTERWSTAAFRAWSAPYFQRETAWTFVPRQRNLFLSAGRDVAWFDEVLDSASYGECRGTGVLQKRDGTWKIEQYNLSIPIPNDLADEFVRQIRALPPK